MKKSRKRKVSKCKIKVFLTLVVFTIITGYLFFNLLNNLIDINKMKNEKIALKDQISDLEKTQKTLETDILKLNDPDYIAKYVREKYFYSKDGELILRMGN